MADVLPDSQRPPSWEPSVTVGIPGGIDAATAGWNVVDVTDFGVSESNTASQNTTAFNNAMNAAPTANKVLYFPAGTFAVSQIGPLSNQVIRGAGMFRTILQVSSKIMLGASAAYNSGTPGAFNPRGKIVGGFTRGSKTLTVEPLNDKLFVANKLTRITIPNDPDLPVISWNPRFLATRTLYIATTSASYNSVSGLWTLQLDVAIPADFSFPESWPDDPATPLYVEIEHVQAALQTPTMRGVEDLAIYGTGTAGQLEIAHGWKMWVKNVRVYNTGTYCFFNTSSTSRFEMRGCFAEGRGLSQNPRHCFRVQDLCCSLVEDNIFYKSNASTINAEGAWSCNAFSYNLIVDGLTYGILPNHQQHAMFNCFEGNIVTNLLVENNGGSSSHVTMHRNWIMALRGTGWDLVSGLPSSGVVLFPVSLKKWARSYYFTCNLLNTPGFALDSDINYGQPHIGNGNWTGEVEPPASYWEDYNVAAKRPNLWTASILEVTPVGTNNNTVKIQITGGDDFSVFVQRALTASTDPTRGNRAEIAILWTTQAFGKIAYADIDVATQQATLRNMNTSPVVDTAVIVCAAVNDWHELDLGSRPVTKRNKTKDGNLVTVTAGSPSSSVGTVASGDLLPGETALASNIHSDQPAFMSGYSWPPFDVDAIDVESLSIRRIPAGTRFLRWVENGSFEEAPIPGTPVFSPVAGTYDATQNVAITADDPIYYTTDGSAPDNTDTLYTSPVAIAATTVLKAVAYDGVNYSMIRTGTFTLKAATPTLNPIAGIYESVQSVTAATTTSGATVHYETGATEGATATPTAASPTTPNPISVTGSVVIKAVAIKSGLGDSDVRTGIYTINLPAEPAPDAPSGLTATTISSSQIDLAWTDNSDNEAGFKIYRGTVSGVLALIDTVEAGVTAYSDTGLAPETTYIYAVTATNDTDDSAATSEATATTDAAVQAAPTRPRLAKFPRKAKRL